MHELYTDNRKRS